MKKTINDEIIKTQSRIIKARDEEISAKDDLIKIQSRIINSTSKDDESSESSEESKTSEEIITDTILLMDMIDKYQKKYTNSLMSTIIDYITNKKTNNKNEYTIKKVKTNIKELFNKNQYNYNILIDIYKNVDDKKSMLDIINKYPETFIEISKLLTVTVGFDYEESNKNNIKIKFDYDKYSITKDTDGKLVTECEGIYIIYFEDTDTNKKYAIHIGEAKAGKDGKGFNRRHDNYFVSPFSVASPTNSRIYTFYNLMNKLGFKSKIMLYPVNANPVKTKYNFFGDDEVFVGIYISQLEGIVRNKYIEYAKEQGINNPKIIISRNFQ